jgi:branched-subunit amino acid transport protein
VSNLQLALATVGILLATLLTRASLLVFGAKLRLHHRVEAALRYAPACALAALLLPALLFQGDALQLDSTNGKLPGALAGALALLATRSVTACIGAGMLVLTLWRTLVA